METRKRWNLETVKETSNKYNTRSEWQKSSPGSYTWAIRNGKIEELTSHMRIKTKPKGYWSKERCIEHAKLFNSKSEWMKSHKMSYESARRKGWLKESSKHMTELRKPNNYWTKEKCLEQAKKYNNVTDWYNTSLVSFNTSIKNDWFNQCVNHMSVKPVNCAAYWTKERCKKESLNYRNKSEWCKSSRLSYNVAKSKGWLF